MRRQVATEALLSHLPLLEGLGRAELARLAGIAGRRALARGEVLFRAGESPAALYAVVYGRIRLTAGERRRVVELVGPGRTFGESVLFLERPNLVTATAAADTLVVALPKQEVLAEIARSPVFARRLIVSLARRVERLVQELHGYRSGAGAERFVRWLLGRRGVPDRGEAKIALPASKAAVAAQLNLSPEHFSRILRGLAAGGLLSVSGRELTIPEVGRLRAFLSGGQGSASARERGRRPRAPSGMHTSTARET